MAVDGWAVTFGTARRGLGGLQPRPVPGCTATNVTAHLSTASVPITVLLYDGPLLCGFNVAIKGLSHNLTSSNIFSHILLSINIRFLSEQYLSGTLFLKPASTWITSPYSRRSSITRPERCAHPHRRDTDTRKWSDDYRTRTRTSSIV